MKMDAAANLDAFGDRGSSWQQVGNFFVCASQDEELCIRLLLAEPKREDFSMEGIFSFDNNISFWNSSSSDVLLHNDSGLLGGIYRVNDDSPEANYDFSGELADEILTDADVPKVVETEHVVSEESVLLKNSSNSDISGSPPILGSSEGSSLATPVAEAESNTTTSASSSRTDTCSLMTRRSEKKKTKSRRHPGQPWTSSEVAKLVEGVAKIGAGRWTDIKNLLFSSYPHRKPDGLRSKWGTLVRASRAQDPNKQENRVEQGKKQARARSAMLSKGLARRVLELASIDRGRGRSESGGRGTRRS